MSTLVIAPLGWRIAAVCCPIAGLPTLGLTEGSRVVLIDTLQIREAGLTERACNWLRKVVPGVQVEASLTSDSDRLCGPAERVLEAALPFETVVLFLNGGTWQLGQTLLDGLWGHPGLSAGTSRDDYATFFSPRASPSTTTIERDAVTFDDLKNLLDLRFSAATLRRAGKSNIRLDAIVDLKVRSGFLFACLDAQLWSTKVAKQRDTYRKLVLDHHRLWDLGLEQRRLFVLAGTNTNLRKRCIEDGTPVDRPDAGFGLTEWQALVTSGPTGSAFCLPETQSAISAFVQCEAEPVESRASRDAHDWDEPPLITIVGTEPGITLESIWTLRPRELHLVFDERQPRAEAVAVQIQRSVPLGSGQVHLHHLTRLPDLRDHIRVDLRPGDKTSTLQLDFWRREAPQRRNVVRIGSPAAVPLSEWRTAHLRASGSAWKVQEPFSASRATLEAALAARDAVAATDDWNHLDNLLARSVPPYVDGDELVVDGGRRFSLLHVDERMKRQFQLPKSGVWFEWCVAAALKDARLEEVEHGTKALWTNGDDRDELDVITRAGNSYAFWSVKTVTKAANEQRRYFAEARAQTDRLLGWGRTAVLVVPKFAEGLDGSNGGGPRVGELIRDGCMRVIRQGGTAGFIVDATFLRTPHLADLAAGKSPFY